MASPLLPLVLSSLLTSPPEASMLDGRRVAHASWRGAVALFWRADCAPCVAELADLAQLRSAAAPMRVQPILLDVAAGDPGPAGAMLAKAGLSPGDTWRARGDPATVLRAYGGEPPRLPLAVAFDGRGRPCGRRTGLLGYDQLRAWAAACARADAPRR